MQWAKFKFPICLLLGVVKKKNNNKKEQKPRYADRRTCFFWFNVTIFIPIK